MNRNHIVTAAAGAVAATAAASLVLPPSAVMWLALAGALGFAGALALNPDTPRGRARTA